jgi:predicted amidohydrolase YtcJ
VGDGYADTHVHLLSWARALTEIDLGHESHPYLSDVLAATASHGRPRPSGWVVMRGFDDALVADRRLPSRAELDATCSRPLRIRHRTGHASLLNSAGFDRLPRLPGWARVEPDDRGLPVMLIGAEAALNQAVGRPSRRALIAGLRCADAHLRRNGIDRVWDAGPSSAQMISERSGLLDEAEFTTACRWMRSARELNGRLPATGETVKLFPEELRHRLADVVRLAHGRGAAVAIHATTAKELDAAIYALRRNHGEAITDRIEHATLVSPAQATKIGRLGIAVVTHPSWLVSRRNKYLAELSSTEMRHLLPLRTLLEAGVAFAFASDAPVDRPDPALWIEAATGRDDDQAIPHDAALAAAQGSSLWAHAPR